MKKKGLIISTVVMVMVLVAALSTATFAWFSSTAQAKIDNISVTTAASEGLVVGVKKAATSYVSGDITYTAGQAESPWTGTLDAMSSLADFTSITTGMGKISNATTRLNASEAAKYFRVDVYSDTFTFANYGKDTIFYKSTTSPFAAIATTATKTAATDGTNAFTAEGKMHGVTDEATFNAAKTAIQTFVGIVTTQTAAIYTQYAEKAMVMPTSYADGMKPVAYMAAKENANYMNLPISVSPTIDVQLVVCTVKVTPIKNGMAAKWMPGMAAASRIVIKDADTEQLFEPFDKYKVVGDAMKDENSAAYSNAIAEYKFVVAYGAATNKVAQGAIYDLNFEIWVEGNDGQCVNVTAGSGFKVDLNYAYEKDNTNMTVTAGTKVVIGAGSTENQGTYNIITGLTTVIA